MVAPGKAPRRRPKPPPRRRAEQRGGAFYAPSWHSGDTNVEFYNHKLMKTGNAPLTNYDWQARDLKRTGELWKLDSLSAYGLPQGYNYDEYHKPKNAANLMAQGKYVFKQNFQTVPLFEEIIDAAGVRDDINNLAKLYAPKAKPCGRDASHDLCPHHNPVPYDGVIRLNTPS
jgi:hypothetical protein